jgi:8-oxo-dGTP pyrophosphatase MutT (NUDIX family)
MDMNMSERTAGGIVIGDGGAIAMVMSKNSQSWLFPKGHIDAGEADEAAAIREIGEETGLKDLEYIADLGSYDRGEKNIHMYLFMAQPHANIILAENMKGEILDATWVPFREVAELLGTPHIDWFIKDRAWFATVFERVRQAIQRD